ncbi:peptidoglycan-binding protein [Streptomyces sp. NPDC059080]|uniref:peptidoglycan-binding protein n=1 Tax=Streptomyces sp. NPDC059080 TaxID=3346718 RepID=UPI0036C54F78
MARWQELPVPLDHRVRQLAVRIRTLKDRSGLSLTALAARTPYSRASWESYLNAEQLPPRNAIEALARVCAADPVRLLALWRSAAEAWEERYLPPVARYGAPDRPVVPAQLPRSGAPQPVDGGEDGGDGGVRPRVVGVLGGVVLATFVAGLLAGRPWLGPEAADAVQGVFTVRRGQERGCVVIRSGGFLHAGHSRTDVRLLDVGSTGWEVVEAQCLLRHRGYSAGAADGVYGPRTQRAVRAFQKASGLTQDGVVGPDTWGALRR